jgi:beta-galactosidase/beta-glucuronidase
MNIPRSEYPRPQFRRGNWINLNGEWEYETDRAASGRERGLPKAGSLPEKIIVPFCRESVLSGIGDKDFCECVWYRRTVNLPEEWLSAGRRVILHIGACDWRTEVWVNGESAGTHIGGYVSFSFDITEKIKGAENVITICAEDKLRSGTQPGGKQSQRYASYGCSYTRTTGIWQTVWLEAVPSGYIKCAKYYPDIINKKLIIEAFCEGCDGQALVAEASYEGRPAGAAGAVVSGGRVMIELKLFDIYLWEIGNGRLYDLKLTVGADSVDSYFGMRSIAADKGVLVLNGKKVFQRLVLDQGFYPDGIYTAREESELIADIQRSLDCGFNGARLHQKVFEPRFLYHCDRMGYIVWGEHANWGLDISKPEAWQGFLPEWLEVVEHDFNHPAIIGWCPLNETQPDQNTEFVKMLGMMTKALDPARLYIDSSGWTHVPGVADITDCHDYDQNPETFRARYMAVAAGEPIKTKRNPYPIFPTFVSEYGGIRWAPENAGWGYGEAPKTGDEFIERFRGLTEAIMQNPVMGGLCYTQLTDVEQEVNGLYTYDRKPKFDPAVFREVLSKKAAAED